MCICFSEARNECEMNINIVLNFLLIKMRLNEVETIMSSNVKQHRAFSIKKKNIYIYIYNGVNHVYHFLVYFNLHVKTGNEKNRNI